MATSIKIDLEVLWEFLCKLVCTHTHMHTKFMPFIIKDSRLICNLLILLSDLVVDLYCVDFFFTQITSSP